MKGQQLSRIITYREALREAIQEEMRRDDRVFMMGLGVAKRGGSFGVSKGLLEEFGPTRMIDTPISESSFTGMGVGAAIQGKRPIVEVMAIDFSTLAFDMMFNQAAKYHFVAGGTERVPMVMRTQGGSGKSVGLQHSQSFEALYYHIPGLKLFMPATPYDAKGLLKAAIRDDDPVVFIEHKLLYDLEGEVPEGDYSVEPGKAVVRREGTDITIVSYSKMANECLAAADRLEPNGISCEVIDLRTLVPMDRETIAASVAKTGRLLVATEAVRRGSVASDIAAWAAENLYDSLEAPVMRIAGRVTPIPYNKRLESEVTPRVDDIVERIVDCVGYGKI